MEVEVDPAVLALVRGHEVPVTGQNLSATCARPPEPGGPGAAGLTVTVRLSRRSASKLDLDPGS
jgi:hypothetical protein